MSPKPVVILTERFRIKGSIDVAPDERVTDFVSKARTFLAVTGAEVRTLDNTLVFRSDFLNVHRDHIVVLAPEELTNRN